MSDAVDPRTDDVAAALTFKPSDDTRIDLDFESVDREQLIYPGLPVPDPRLPRTLSVSLTFPF